MIRNGAVLSTMLLAGAILLAGCTPPKPLPPPMTLEQVVGSINANNSQLPAFKAHIETVTGTLVLDDKGKTQDLGMLDLGGLLVYAQPAHVYMDVSKAGQSVMGLGGNDKLFWFWGAAPYVGKCWVGSNAGLDGGDSPAAAPVIDGRRIPIHPRQLTQLLGVDEIPNLQARPWPVLRESEAAERAYFVQFVQPVAGQATLVRELVYDRDDRRPRAVRLFDGQGQIVVHSTLAGWKKAKDSTGLFPHDVDIQWIVREPVVVKGKLGIVERPGTRLRLLFRDVEVDAKFGGENKIYQYRAHEELETVPLDGPAGAAAKGEAS